MTLASLGVWRIGFVYKSLVRVGSADFVHGAGDACFEKIGFGGGFGRDYVRNTLDKIARNQYGLGDL
jgi:hypothetical protein